jgi:hypothetical protein
MTQQPINIKDDERRLCRYRHGSRNANNRPATEQEKQHDDYQDQVDCFPEGSGRQACRTDEFPVVFPSANSLQP